MTTNPVEIKVTLSGQVPDALSILHLEEGTPWNIWFLDDLTPGIKSPLPLLKASTIVRLRSSKNKADSTLKLRPCRHSQLTSKWEKSSADGKKYRLEQDWAGERRALAASAVQALDPELVETAISGDSDISTLFSDHQKSFLADCADLRVAFAGLTTLGPVTAMKWKGTRIGDFDADVNAERWTVGNFDFLELSIRTEADAGKQQKRFDDAVRQQGLSVTTDQESKTDTVMTYLAQTRRTAVHSPHWLS
jgi:hypothetical protein